MTTRVTRLIGLTRSFERELGIEPILPRRWYDGYLEEERRKLEEERQRVADLSRLADERRFRQEARTRQRTRTAGSKSVTTRANGSSRFTDLQVTDRRGGIVNGANGHNGTAVNGSQLVHANGHGGLNGYNGHAVEVAAEEAEILAASVPTQTYTETLTTIATRFQGRDNHLQYQQPILQDIGSYTWFSRKNEEYAREAFEGAQAAAQHNQKQGVIYTISAIIDLYHKDRSEHAAHLVRTKPIKVGEIPQRMPGKPSLHLQLTPLNQWQPDTPYEVIRPMTKILKEVAPDQFQLAIYAKPPPPQPQVAYIPYIDDPIIYAVYGLWYVEVAHWD
jgi:hypothetical protein